MIGIGMLGFLVPYDAVMALFGQTGNRDVGEVNGVAISGAQYQMEVQERRRLGFSGDQLTGKFGTTSPLRLYSEMTSMPWG